MDEMLLVAGGVALLCLLGLVWFVWTHEFVKCKVCGKWLAYRKRLFHWIEKSSRTIGYHWEGDLAFPRIVYTKAELNTSCPNCKRLIHVVVALWMPDSMAVVSKTSVKGIKCKACNGSGILRVQNLSYEAQSRLSDQEPSIQCVMCNGMGLCKE